MKPPIDPNAAKIIEALTVTAAAINQGVNAGAILITFNHQINGIGAEVYNTGDHYRCYAFLHQLADVIMQSGIRAQQSKAGIIVPFPASH